MDSSVAACEGVRCREEELATGPVAGMVAGRETLAMRPMIDAISPDEYAARLEALAILMAEQRLDALVAFSNRVHPGHVRYLTGYETWLGIHDSAACVVRADGKNGGIRQCALITNASFDPPAPRPWLDEILITGDYAAAVKAWL